MHGNLQALCPTCKVAVDVAVGP